jgi:isochorismate pyruvate lyase
MRYIEAAARIKPNRSAVLDQNRVDDVLEKVRRTAENVDFPPELVKRVYGKLVEGSIMHEFARWDDIRSSVTVVEEVDDEVVKEEKAM